MRSWVVHRAWLGHGSWGIGTTGRQRCGEVRGNFRGEDRGGWGDDEFLSDHTKEGLSES